MGEYNKFGTGAPLKDGPRSVEHTGGGGGQREDFGSKAALDRTPSSNKFHSGGGSREDFGSKAPLGSTPIKGYQSANTPMSKRSIKQSQ